MAKLLDLKEKPPKLNPLIEIIGTLDIGKTPVAQLIAKRIGASFISFPILDPTTLTGRGLLHSLSTNPKGLELNPYWWAHIYAANMYEQATKIRDLLKSGPVVVTNYTLAYEAWMRPLGINTTSFIAELPSPAIAYLLSGDKIVDTPKPIFQFSSEFQVKLRRALSTRSFDKRIRKVILADFFSKYSHTYVNNLSVAISSDINKKYNCKLNELELYGPDAFFRV